MALNMGTESEGGFFFKAVDHFQSSVHAACVRANVKNWMYISHTRSRVTHIIYHIARRSCQEKCFHTHGWRLKSFNTSTPVEA